MVTLSIKAVPNASRDEISGWLGDALKIRVTAPPEKGKANQSIIRLLSRELGIPASQVRITDGQASPRKKASIEGITEAQLKDALEKYR